MVDQLAVKAAEEGDSHNLNILKPFVSEDVIGDIARKWIAEGKSITGLAPFICEDDMYEFVNDLYQKSGLGGLGGILPFICEDQLEEIAKQEYANNGLRNFGVIAPFLDSEMLSEFVKEEYLK